VSLPVPVAAAPMRPRRNTMTGGTFVGNFRKQVLPTDSYPCVITAGNGAQCMLFAISGTAGIPIVVEGLDYPSRRLTVPLFSDVFRSKRNEAGCIDDGI